MCNSLTLSLRIVYRFYLPPHRHSLNRCPRLSLSSSLYSFVSPAFFYSPHSLLPFSPSQFLCRLFSFSTTILSCVSLTHIPLFLSFMLLTYSLSSLSLSLFCLMIDLHSFHVDNKLSISHTLSLSFAVRFLFRISPFTVPLLILIYSHKLSDAFHCGLPPLSLTHSHPLSLLSFLSCYSPLSHPLTISPTVSSSSFASR